MSHIVLVFSFLLLSLSIKAQKVLSFKMYDKNGDSVTNSKKAHSFEKLEKINDTLFNKIAYVYDGPCIQIVSYKDATTLQKNGLSVWYDSKGILDSVKFFLNNDPVYVFKCQNKNITNSISHGCTPDLQKLITKTSFEKKSTTQNRFSAFKGDFLKYISNHFIFPQYSEIKNIAGEAYLTFIIDEKGKVDFPILITSIEYNVDNEIIRVIKKSSGKWLPTIENYVIKPSLHSQKFQIIR